MPSVDLELLAKTCATHVDGTQPTSYLMAVCWDADRLDLSRFYWDIDAERLSTRTGKRIGRDLSGQFPERVALLRKGYGAEG